MLMLNALACWVCGGGGGYAINAALTEKRIKAVVSITGVNIGRLFREGFSNYDPIGVLNAMASQRAKEARGGELQINELLPASLDAAKAHGLTERDVYEATDYYKTPRGQQPGGATKMLFSHAQKTLAWDAFAFTEVLLTQPVMVVVGEKVGAFGAYRDGLEVYGRAMVSQDRQLVSLPDFSHYELYDKPGSEPETQALCQLIHRIQPAWVVSFHDPLACIEDPRHSELGEWLAQSFELPLVTSVGYETPGSFGSWCADLNLHCITAEFPPISSDEASEKYLFAMANLLRWHPKDAIRPS